MYALKDINMAIMAFPSWAYIGAKRLQLEYRRTIVGSLWLILGFGISTTGIAVLLAQLQGMTLAIHVPYVAFGMAIWNFISMSMIGGSTVFEQNRAMMLQLPLPRTAFVISHVVKNLILFAINLATACVISLLFGWTPSVETFVIVPALLLCIPAAFAVTTLMGVIATRIPDLGELTASIMRLGFFLTPIFWRVDAPSARFHGADQTLDILGLMTIWNPFTHFLEIVRDPLLGEASTLLNWQVSIVLVGALVVAALIALQIAGRRVTYWL